MNIKNLHRAAEIDSLLMSLTKVRASLSDDKPISINGIALPHEVSYRILQVINLEINNLHKEIESL